MNDITGFWIQPDLLNEMASTKEPRLTVRECILMAYIRSRGTNLDSIEHLQKAMGGVCRRTISRMLTNLQIQGWVNITSNGRVRTVEFL